MREEEEKENEEGKKEGEKEAEQENNSEEGDSFVIESDAPLLFTKLVTSMG